MEEATDNEFSQPPQNLFDSEFQTESRWSLGGKTTVYDPNFLDEVQRRATGTDKESLTKFLKEESSFWNREPTEEGVRPPIAFTNAVAKISSGAKNFLGYANISDIPVGVQKRFAILSVIADVSTSADKSNSSHVFASEVTKSAISGVYAEGVTAAIASVCARDARSCIIGAAIVGIAANYAGDEFLDAVFDAKIDTRASDGSYIPLYGPPAFWTQ